MGELPYKCRTNSRDRTSLTCQAALVRVRALKQRSNVSFKDLVESKLVLESLLKLLYSGWWNLLLTASLSLTLALCLIISLKWKAYMMPAITATLTSNNQKKITKGAPKCYHREVKAWQKRHNTMPFIHMRVMTKIFSTLLERKIGTKTCRLSTSTGDKDISKLSSSRAVICPSYHSPEQQDNFNHTRRALLPYLAFLCVCVCVEVRCLEVRGSVKCRSLYTEKGWQISRILASVSIL